MFRIDTPAAMEKLVGNIYIAVLKSTESESFDLLVGPLLTSAEAMQMMPAAISLHTILGQKADTPSLVYGLVQLNEGESPGRYNRHFCLRDDGTDATDEEYANTLDELERNHSEAKKDATWIGALPTPLFSVVSKRAEYLVTKYNAVGNVEDAVAVFDNTDSIEVRDEIMELLELFVACGDRIPPRLATRLMRAAVVRRHSGMYP